MLALSNRPVEEGWAGFGRVKGPSVRCPPEKHGSQCLRAIITLGEAWLDTERAELVGVGSRGRKNRKDGASAPLGSGSGRQPHRTFQGPVWSWCWGPGSSSPRTHCGILALDGRAIADLTFRVKSLVLVAKRSWDGSSGLIFSHFKLQHRIIIITSCLIFHQYIMRSKALAFRSNWLGFESWLHLLVVRLWANCVNFSTL